MKNRFTTLDIVCLVQELRQKLVGLRCDQVYDVDKKTFLIRLTKTDTKEVLLLESGARFHTTSFDWPKNPAPSGFSMKLRKHLNNKRLEKIEQLGADRIVDFEFGTHAHTHHLILELYDKGNILLTDGAYEILSVLRPHGQGEDRLVAYKTYMIDKVKKDFSVSKETTLDLVQNSAGKSLREVFLSKIEFGPALFAHVLKMEQLTSQTKIPSDSADSTFSDRVFKALELGRSILEGTAQTGGFITLSADTSGKKKNQEPEPVQPELYFYDQFHPIVLLPDFSQGKFTEFPSFNVAIDEFFSKIESQKLDMKQLNHEKDAIKKLEKVKQDQLKRLQELKIGQEVDKVKAELIMMNQPLIESAIAVVRKMVASQIPWNEIWDHIQKAQATGDSLANSITGINLQKNQVSMQLLDVLTEDEEGKFQSVDVDLGLSAFANATKYYDLKKASAKKEERTLESQEKAFKSTEKKTMASLREVATIHSIKKARKVLWFEKFRWFISSENYLILAGRDAQQNELLVKRYLKPKDVYLHADTHGAPTVVLKNDNPSELLPPKTLNEAGAYAVACSGSWESKVVTSSWWVWGDQVSKSAPTGEYLPTGSFMVRGKKNYLPPCQLVLGFGFLFRLTEECIEKHKNERSRRPIGDDKEDAISSHTQQNTEDNEEEIPVSDDSDSSDENEFPDTRVELQVDDDQNKVRARTISTVSSGKSSMTGVSVASTFPSDEGDDAIYIVESTPQPISISAQKLKSDKKKAEKKKVKETGQKKGRKEVPLPPVEEDDDDFTKTKRGQRGKNKKKEKYKFQDDDDKTRKMHLLKGGGKPRSSPQSPPKPPPSVKLSKQTEDEDPMEPQVKAETQEELSLPHVENDAELDDTIAPESKEPKLVKPEPVKSQTEDTDNQYQEIDNEPEDATETDLHQFSSLTGSPFEDDELLYAVPVVAPYVCLQNYKFRIKMVPGTTKRGRAVKAALEYFLRDKTATPREKDLLKSVKDQDLGRNIPGKVKLAGGGDKK